MAKTAAERTKASRQRLKENGGTVFYMTLSPEQVTATQLLGKMHGLDLSLNETLKDIIQTTLNRMTNTLLERIRLEEEFKASDETINAYILNEAKRWIPLTAERFLAGDR